MAKPNPANLLALAQKEYEKQKAQLEADLIRKTNELLLDVKKELAEKLSDALTVYNSIPVDARKGVFSEPPIEDVLKSLGLEVKTDKPAKAKGTRASRTPLSDEGILKFIGEESKTKSELCKEFSGGNPKVIEALNALVKAKKLATFEHKGKGPPSTAYKKA